MLARKRPVRAKLEQPSEFKLTSPEKPELKESPKKPELKTKKLKEISAPSAILEKVLNNDPKFDIPQALPTVDFMDEPGSKRHKNKKHEKQSSLIDFANEPVKRIDKQAPKKKQKTKFSKVTNPFPNDPSKNPGKMEPIAAEKAPEDTKKFVHEKGSNTGTNNLNVFTVDSVDSLKIHPFAIRNLKELLNYTKLTHVQQKSIPPALEGKDLLIRSPTGNFLIYVLFLK